MKAIQKQVAALVAQIQKQDALVTKRGMSTLAVQVRRAALVAKAQQVWDDNRAAFKAAGIAKAEYLEQFGISSTGWSRCLKIDQHHTEDTFAAYAAHCSDANVNPSEKGYQAFVTPAKEGSDEKEVTKYLSISNGSNGDRIRIPVRELTPEQIEAMSTLFGIII